jgi:malate/lactate dehydrogenase
MSMAVYSRGEYGAPTDVVFSFPVTCVNGEWKIVGNLKLSNLSKEKIAITGKELIEERETALGK